MKKVLIISFSTIASDPRIIRQVNFLKDQYQITVAGFGEFPAENVNHVKVRGPETKWDVLWRLPFLLSRLFSIYYWTSPAVKDALAKLTGIQCDLIIANEIETLPLALRIAGKAKILLDAHEYTPEEQDRLKWKLLYKGFKVFLCNRYIRHADRVSTVSEGIAVKYEETFGIPRPFVVSNAPFSQTVPVKKTQSPVRIIHHGAALPGRGIDSFIEVMKYLDNRFELYLMLVPTNAGYYNALKKKARNIPGVYFEAPVKFQNIVSSIAAYDIGLYMLEPSNINSKLALPNKFFEFIQARLALAIGPSPEMASIARKHNLGVISPDFDPRSMAAMLKELTPAQIDLYKHNADKAAGIYNAENNRRALLDEVNRLLL